MCQHCVGDIAVPVTARILLSRNLGGEDMPDIHTHKHKKIGTKIEVGFEREMEQELLGSLWSREASLRRLPLPGQT